MKQSDPIARLLSHTLSVPDDHTIAPDFAVGRIASRTMEIGVWRMRLPEADFVFSEQARIILGLPADTVPIPVEQFIKRFSKQGRLTAAQMIKGALEERRGFQVEAEMIDFQNHAHHLEYFGDVEFDGHGGLSGLVGTVRDVTAIRRAEQLATSRMLIIKSLMKHAPLAIAILEKTMHYIAASDYWVAGHGLKSASDLIGKCHYDLFDIPEPMRREHKQVLAGVTLKRPRSFLKDKSGQSITQVATLAPWYERPNEVGGMLIMLSEVDEANVVDPGNAINDKPTAGEFDNLIMDLSRA